MTPNRATATMPPPLMRARALQPVRVELAFGWLAFSAIYLQKITVPGLGADFGLNHLILWGTLLWLVVRRAATVHPLRLALYMATFCAVILSLILEQSIFSLPALILFLFVQAAVLMVVDVDLATALRCYRIFQAFMVPIAYIVIGQQVVQFTIGNAFWPNPDNVIPSAILMQGATYLRPMDWQSPYLIPNGVFFLEPSAASLFIAVSAAIEIVWLKRLRYVCLFGVVLLISMTGTGITDIALLSPALLAQMDRSMRRQVFKIGIPLVAIVGATGAISYLANRSGEISDPHSSGYARLYLPFTSTVDLFVDPSHLISGTGPGSTPKFPASRVTWPSSKLAYEYGTLTSIAFHVFLFVSVLGEATSRVVCWVGLLPTLVFGGGFLAAPNTMLMVMFGSLLRVRKSE